MWRWFTGTTENSGCWWTGRRLWMGVQWQSWEYFPPAPRSWKPFASISPRPGEPPDGGGQMAELKTKPTSDSAKTFLGKVSGGSRRQDCMTLLAMMKKASRKEPKMWGAGMVGFGNYHYKYASGHEGDCFLIGFAPRKQALTLYLMCGLERHKSLLKKLGKH